MRNTSRIHYVWGLILTFLMLGTGAGAQQATHLHLDAADGMVAEFITCLAEDTTGIIWMGTTEGLQGYNGVGFEHYSTDNSNLPGNVFTAIWAEPQGGRLWLGLNSGLAVMDIRTRHIETIWSNDFFNIADLAPAADGGLWILNVNKRFGHLDLRTREITTYRIADFPGVATRLGALQDLGGGQLQVEDGERRWNIDLATHKVVEVDLPEGWNDIEERRHFTDRYGNRWTGSSQGLDCETHRSSPFVLLPMADNGSTFAHSMMEAPTGDLWVGYENQLLLMSADCTVLRRINAQNWQGPKHFIPTDMVMEANGQVLIGTEANGLWRYSPQTGLAHQLSTDDAHRSFYSLHRQRGRWLAGTSSGVYELRDGEDCIRPVAAINKAIPSHYIFGLETDAEGKTWVGIFGSGIQVFDKQMHHILSLQPDTFPSGAINHLFRDSRNRIWAATCEGVACFSDTRHPEQFEAYSISDGLPTLYTNAVGEDKNGRIWVTTNRGLVRWDEATHQFCTYGHQEGLNHHPYCNGLIHCLTDGRMIVGGENGISVFVPTTVAKPTTLPRLRLMSFTLLTLGGAGETVATIVPEDSLSFSHRDNSFILTFGLADAALKGVVEYAYRINKGPWMSLGKEPQLTLHGLQPGRYTVEMRMRQMGQPWLNKAACSVNFRVRPPWWQTGWAYMIYALLVLAIIIYTMYSWRHRLILEHNLRYAEMRIEEMRKKIIAPSPTKATTETASNEEEEQNNNQNEANDAFIEHLSRVILENIDNTELDIDLLTDYMAMSRSTLYRRVKTTLGMSANEYIRWVRLGEAARRIRNGDLNEQTIAAIAVDCGFNNLRYFRSCFKERYGVTPSEYGK